MREQSREKDRFCIPTHRLVLEPINVCLSVVEDDFQGHRLSVVLPANDFAKRPPSDDGGIVIGVVLDVARPEGDRGQRLGLFVRLEHLFELLHFITHLLSCRRDPDFCLLAFIHDQHACNGTYHEDELRREHQERRA